MSEPSDDDILPGKPPSGRHRGVYALLTGESSLEDMVAAINRMNTDLHFMQLAMREFGKSLAELRATLDHDRLGAGTTVRIERVQGAAAMSMLAFAVAFGAMVAWVLLHFLPR